MCKHTFKFGPFDVKRDVRDVNLEPTNRRLKQRIYIFGLYRLPDEKQYRDHHEPVIAPENENDVGNDDHDLDDHYDRNPY